MTRPPYTTDTSPEAEAIQLELFRKMSPIERLRRAFGLSNELRRMAFAAIQRRHPGLSDNDVRLKFIEMGLHLSHLRP